MRKLPFEYAVRNLGRSPLRLALSVGGSTLVVLLVLAAAGFTNGMQKAMHVSASQDRVMLIGSGSEESIERSEIPMRAAGIVSASVPGLLKRAGVDAVSPEIHLAMPLATEPEQPGRLAVIRGITPEAWLVHDDVRLISGHAPRPGHSELASGRLAARSLGYDPPESILGTTFRIDDESYEVVGLLDAGGGVIDGELWTSLTDLQVTAQRDSLSTVMLRMDDAEFADLEAFAASRLDLELAAIAETDYYAQLDAFYRPIRLLVIVTAVLIAIGGITGGLNTMYAAFASRVREIGSLQTLGYSRASILWSLVQESILASSIGALIACVLGLLVLDHFVIRFSMGVFGISIDAGVLSLGLAVGLFLGIIGAAVPAWRCLRRPIPEALRAGE
ncbi:MAG: ABC transporter permease [Phycisphaerales bacterium]|nr:ABC transporter permease [Phycisphaerales bacterium]